MKREQDLERRFAKSLAKFRELRRVNPRVRPFMVETFGLPKSGKTTLNDTVQHFLKREGWKISAPPEGPEVIETPRDTPFYNCRTFWYAMCQAHDRAESLFEAVMLERAIFDHATWLEYWVRKGKLDEAGRAVSQAYCLQPLIRDRFDLHICLVSDPKVALEREVARTISKHEGETMNTKTMDALYDIHRQVWEKFGCKDDPKMLWIDSTALSLEELCLTALEAICAAFERRLKGL